MKGTILKWVTFAWAARWVKGLMGQDEEEEGGSMLGKSGGFLLGLAGGAGLMYFLDPDSGARRRAWMRDKFVKGSHELEDFTEAKTEYYKGKAEGMAAETKARMQEEDVDDATLVERVRSELGHEVSNAGSLEVTAANGAVTLRGPILSTERSRAVSTAKSVRGVKEVVDELEVHEDRGSVPGLQK